MIRKSVLAAASVVALSTACLATSTQAVAYEWGGRSITIDRNGYVDVDFDVDKAVACSSRNWTFCVDSDDDDDDDDDD
jgi:hypothetical protein